MNISTAKTQRILTALNSANCAGGDKVLSQSILKSEGRKKAEFRNPNQRAAATSVGFRPSAFFRPSDFGFRNLSCLHARKSQFKTVHWPPGLRALPTSGPGMRALLGP